MAFFKHYSKDYARANSLSHKEVLEKIRNGSLEGVEENGFMFVRFEKEEHQASNAESYDVIEADRRRGQAFAEEQKTVEFRKKFVLCLYCGKSIPSAAYAEHGCFCNPEHKKLFAEAS
jgi:hypothetical protein